MTVTVTDGLFQFGTTQTAEVPSTPGLANDATPKAPLGCLYRAGGKVWRYVKFDNGADNVAAAAYGVAHWYGLDPPNSIFTVTSDQSDSGYLNTASNPGMANVVAGIFGCVVTDGYYTWIQVGGLATCLLLFTSLSGDPVAAAVAGCKCIYSTTDLYFNMYAAATAATPRAVIYGVLIGDVDYTTTHTGTVLLQNLEW